MTEAPTQTAKNNMGPDAPVQRHLSGVVATVSADASLREVARKLMAIEAGALVVGSPDQVDGMITERDVVRAVGLGRDLDTVRAADVARSDIAWCSPQTTMADVATIMAAQGVRHVLVGERGRLAGIVSARDVLFATGG